MKLNWGHKLIFVFMVFGSGMSYLVYRCVKTNNELVSKEYYKDELVYQQVIDDAARAAKLSEQINLVQDDAAVTIRFPREMKNAAVKGYAWFYCAADAHKDRRIALAVDENGIQHTGERSILPGHYIVKISWNSNGKDYYSEQPFSMQ